MSLVRTLLTVLIFFYVSANTFANDKRCIVDVKLPANWTTSSADGKTIYISPYGFASLKVECTILVKALTDIDFAYHIAMEGAEEGGALKTIGSFRGQSWTIEKYKSIEWWLKKDNYKIHLVLRSNNGPLPGNLEEEVNDIIGMMRVSAAK